MAIVEDKIYLTQAIELAQLCPASATAFSVGAVIVGKDGKVLSTGYSREDNPSSHAEEVALAKLGGKAPEATLYCSLEPCGERVSGKKSCAARILSAGIIRVVYAKPEPPTFIAKPVGAATLQAAGVVVERIDI
jgi:diaminohydroxyphosphoribosylaminopyrimidine deaminase/5-amino-6-(5-phosphoribosylamino)uracil reductase